MSAVIMLFGTAICLCIPEQLFSLFTENAGTIQAGGRALRIISAGFLVSSVSVTSGGALEGLGKGVPSLVISLLRYILLIIPAAFLPEPFSGSGRRVACVLGEQNRFSGPRRNIRFTEKRQR